MRLKGAFSPEDVCMPPTAEQGEPVGAAPVDEKLAETLEEIGTVDTFDVGQIHVSVGYGGEWYGWYACNTFWEGGVIP